ncbi:MAG: helix-turn-helix domain-containing protein [Tannerellaceae bacterium]|jgi:AraC-like DNA-binding protein|nr:helix-turn-helix domain-containing protein [Tannerellaceae bacterium]
MSEKCRNDRPCTTCEYLLRDVFSFHRHPRGLFLPRRDCTQNVIYFLLKGELWINSNEHPDTILREGDFVLQPAGSTVEFRIHTPVETVTCLFDHLPNVCDARFQEHMNQAGSATPPLVVMHVRPPLCPFLEGVKIVLNDHLPCAKYIQSKQTELFCLLDYAYTLKELSDFYAPVYGKNRSFRSFVMNNYPLAKDVETFAQLSGYSVPTFRKLFRETFDEPVYQWILKQKCRDIYADVTTTDMSITEISNKHKFESLANFSHFCRANFGKSPRALRSK